MLTLVAATVIHIVETAKPPFVVVDVGAQGGVEVGQEICVYSAKSDEEIGCAKVTSVRETASGVAFPAKVRKQIRVGDRAELMDDADVENETTSKGVSVNYLVSVAQPTTYNAVGFNSKAIVDATERSWSDTKVVDQATFGLSVGFHKSLGNRLELVPAFLLFLNEDVKSKSAFTASGVTGAVESETMGGIVALACDARYAALQGSAWTLWVGTGLSLVSSTVDVEARYSPLGATSSKVADYNSYLHLAAADVTTAFEYALGDAFVALSANAAVPLVTLSKGDSGEVDFTSGDFGDASFELDELEKAVDHEPASLGMSVGLGVGFRF